jgi:hypothetical protein
MRGKGPVPGTFDWRKTTGTSPEFINGRAKLNSAEYGRVPYEEALKCSCLNLSDAKAFRHRAIRLRNRW